MTWDATKPAGSLPASQGGADIRTNNAHLEAALAGEHDYPGSATPGPRRHKFPRLDASGRAALTGQVDGTLIFRTDRKQIDVYNGSAWDEYAALPVASIMPWGGAVSNIPGGWLQCNGAEVSKATYAALWTAFGTTHLYGTPADPTNNFLLPLFSGKVAVGYDSGDTDFNAVGKTGGSKTVALEPDEIPPVDPTSGDHDHSVAASPSSTVTADSGAGVTLPHPSHVHTTSTQGPHDHTFTGAGAGHPNIQPFVTVLYLIKV